MDGRRRPNEGGREHDPEKWTPAFANAHARAGARMSEPLVVIGNGMAAARLVDEIARRALGRYAIAVIGEEPLLAYNRVLLSALLADEVALTDVELKPARWWRD